MHGNCATIVITEGKVSPPKNSAPCMRTWVTTFALLGGVVHSVLVSHTIDAGSIPGNSGRVFPMIRSLLIHVSLRYCSSIFFLMRDKLESLRHGRGGFEPAVKQGQHSSHTATKFT